MTKTMKEQSFDGKLFRIVDGDMVVGRIVFWNLNPEKNAWRLLGLFVIPEYRRKGIATKLIKKGQELASAISLNCYNRDYLIRMYSKCGFVVTGDAPMANNERQVNMEWKKQ